MGNRKTVDKCSLFCSAHFGFDAMKTPGISDAVGADMIGAVTASRSDLLKRVERWTQGRKIMLCRGLCAAAITASEVMLAHGLARDEIERWMEAYKRKDFEALKAGYRRRIAPHT